MTERATAMLNADLLNLSPSERLLLAQELWDSLNPNDIPLTEQQKQELDRRKAAYQANPTAGRSWDEVQQRIISQHG
jgi:putative addiction module component (TIGR02574 family)